MRVLLVDDDTLVRKGLAHLLASFIDGADVTEASDTAEALAAAEKQEFDVVLVDIRLPGPDGLDLLRQVRSLRPDLPVIMLTGYDDPAYVRAALSEGAAGYLLKDSTPEDLSQAIRVALAGSGNVLSPRAVRNLFQQTRQTEPGSSGSSGRIDPGLTRRETDILRYLAQGSSNREISKALFLSEKTVKAHLAAVFRKLGVTNRTKAAMAAVSMGLAGPPGVDDPPGPDGPRSGASNHTPGPQSVRARSASY